jgi:hypothetical protein
LPSEVVSHELGGEEAEELFRLAYEQAENAD